MCLFHLFREGKKAAHRAAFRLELKVTTRGEEQTEEGFFGFFCEAQWIYSPLRILTHLDGATHTLPRANATRNCVSGSFFFLKASQRCSEARLDENDSRKEKH